MMKKRIGGKNKKPPWKDGNTALNTIFRFYENFKFYGIRLKKIFCENFKFLVKKYLNLFKNEILIM